MNSKELKFVVTSLGSGAHVGNLVFESSRLCADFRISVSYEIQASSTSCNRRNAVGAVRWTFYRRCHPV